jgi:hypothetical protein
VSAQAGEAGAQAGEAVQKAGFGRRCAKAGPDLVAWRAQSFGVEVDEAHLPRAVDPRARLP